MAEYYENGSEVTSRTISLPLQFELSSQDYLGPDQIYLLSCQDFHLQLGQLAQIHQQYE